jgi:hypothetical protein
MIGANGAILQGEVPAGQPAPAAEVDVWSVKAHVTRVAALPIGRDLPQSALDVLALVGQLADQYLEVVARDDAVDRRLEVRNRELDMLGFVIEQCDDPIRERLLRERALYRGRREAIVEKLTEAANLLRAS